MDRLACISVPALALQVALRHFSPGHRAPLVLVKEDKPTSAIVQLNGAARRQGLKAGMRYSEALSIVCDLKAVMVSPAELALARQEILEVLQSWTPVVEVCPFDEASFWAGASGLSQLYGTEAQWGASIRAALAERRYRSVVAVGLTRGGTYVVARTRRTSTVVRSAEAEQAAFRQAPLSLFPLTVRQRRLLARLNLNTLGSVLDLPPAELARRFGPDLVQELRRLETLSTLPLQGTAGASELVRARRLEAGVSDRQALLPLLEAPLHDGLAVLAKRGRLLAELRVVFVLESGALVTEVLRPADPTLQASVLLRLLDLRLAGSVFPTAVVELRLAFFDVPLPASTGELFAPPTVRDLRRGGEALALLRAQWGNAAVVRAVLLDSHCPERSFRWEALEHLEVPCPGQPRSVVPTAVRRIRFTPGGTQRNPSGQRLGRSCRLKVASGPQPVDKDYSFLRNARREVAWVSWDRLAGQPCWEGMVD